MVVGARRWPRCGCLPRYAGRRVGHAVGHVLRSSGRYLGTAAICPHSRPQPGQTGGRASPRRCHMILRLTLVLGVAAASSACFHHWQAVSKFDLDAPITPYCARAVVLGRRVDPPDLGGINAGFFLVIEEGRGYWEVEQRPRADSTVELKVT